MSDAPDPPHPPVSDLLREADQRLVRTVDAMSAADAGAPSLLPGWTRAHVVAHLALNAEALARVLTGLRHRQMRTMYDSQEARDTDIDQLGSAPHERLRERFLASVTLFADALESMTADDEGALFDRTPGGRVIEVRAIPLMRLREVEIHHADLGAGYSAASWPEDFAELLIETEAGHAHDQVFRVHASDLALTWQLGREPADEGGPLVTGSAADLGWWLTGRGDGDGLVTDGATLPRIGPW